MQLIASAAAVMLWLLSGFFFVILGNGRTYQVRTVGGGLEVSWGTPHSWPIRNSDFYEGFDAGVRSRFGFTPLPYGDNLSGWHVVGMPLWPLAVIGLYLGARALRRLKRQRSICRCWNCGYDVRALLEPRCPECGEPIIEKERKQASGDAERNR